MRSPAVVGTVHQNAIRVSGFVVEEQRGTSCSADVILLSRHWSNARCTYSALIKTGSPVIDHGSETPREQAPPSRMTPSHRDTSAHHQRHQRRCSYLLSGGSGRVLRLRDNIQDAARLTPYTLQSTHRHQLVDTVGLRGEYGWRVNDRKTSSRCPAEGLY